MNPKPHKLVLTNIPHKTDFAFVGLKFFEKVAAQIQKYPVQIKMGGYTMEFHVELKHGVYPELGGQGATTSISEILCFAKIRVRL
jgi:hypothetical protein